MRNCFYLTLILTIIFLGNVQAQNISQDKRIQELEEICKQQEGLLKKLQNRVDSLDKPSKEKTRQVVKEYLQQPQAEEEVGITAGYEDGFFVRSADGNLQLKINGLLQTGLAIFENATTENNTFFLNEAIMMFDINIWKHWGAYVAINFAEVNNVHFQNGTYGVAVWDAYLEYKPMAEFNVMVGNIYHPFSNEGFYWGYERMTIWVEPFSASWDPGYSPGVMAHGLIADMFQYKIGLFNGEAANGEGGLRVNNSDDFTFSSEIKIYPFKNSVNANTFFRVAAIYGRNPEASESARLVLPWGRQAFDAGGFAPGGATNTYSDLVQGWRTAVDVGARYDQDFDGNNIRIEAEFMYSDWQRDISGIDIDGDGINDSAEGTHLIGWGASFGIAYRHKVADVEGSGLVPAFKFSYTDIDNDDSATIGDPGTGDNIIGQTAYVYTVGLGYKFNKHIFLNFNWIMVDLREKDIFGGPKDTADVSGDIEHAWFVQLSSNF